MKELSEESEIRRANLILFCKEAGSQKALAEILEKTPGYINQILKGHRSIGEKSARKIEKKLGVRKNLLDEENQLAEKTKFNYPNKAGGTTYTSSISVPREAFLFSKDVKFPVIKQANILDWDNVDDLPQDSHALVSRVRVKLSAGDGEYTTEEEAGEPLAFSKNWLLSKNVTRNSNLVLVTATGTSMEPMIRDGAMLLVDTGQKEIIDGKVYAIRYGNDLRVKRLFKRFDNGLTIRSDNPDYPDEELSPEDMNDHIFAIGLVLWQAGDVF